MSKKIIFTTILALAATFADAQWQLTNGPYSGPINCSAVSGTIIYEGTKGWFMFLSSKNGNCRTATNTGMLSTAILSSLTSCTNIIPRSVFMARTGEFALILRNHSEFYIIKFDKK